MLFTIFSQLTFADPSGDTYHVSSALEMEMLKVKVKRSGNPVSFIMGSIEDEPSRLINENQHQVYLTKDYYLGKYEVTQAEYEAVIRVTKKGLNPVLVILPKLEPGRLKVYLGMKQTSLFIYLMKKKKTLGDCLAVGVIPFQPKQNGSLLVGRGLAHLSIQEIK